MAVLQPAIEDERKARLTNISPTIGVGSLGCGLTMSWTDWRVGTEIRFPDVPHATLGEFVSIHWPTDRLVVEQGPSGMHSRVDTVTIFAGREPSAPRLPNTGVTDPSGRGMTLTERRSPAPGLRERELEWRRTHAETLRQFENEWVALEGEEIIAHNRDPVQVFEEARRRGIRSPYIFYVEPTDENIVRIGL